MVFALFRGGSLHGRLLRGAGGSGGGRGGGCHGRLQLRQVDDLDERHRRAVRLALAQLHDAAVPALAVLRGLCHFREELGNDLRLRERGQGLPAGVEGGLLGQGDELLHVGAESLGLGQGGGDAAVADEAASLVGQHGLAM